MQSPALHPWGAPNPLNGIYEANWFFCPIKWRREGEGVESPGCACAFLTAPTSSHSMRLGLGVPQSLLNAGDLQMWGVGPPQCTPCISSPVTGGRGQGRPGLASIEVGLQAGIGESGWIRVLGALAGASGSGCYMGRCSCWFETGEARRVQNHPAPTATSAEKCAGGTPLYGVQ